MMKNLLASLILCLTAACSATIRPSVEVVSTHATSTHEIPRVGIATLESTTTAPVNVTATATLGKSLTPSNCPGWLDPNAPGVYLDFDPAFDLRSGPGCGYSAISTPIDKMDPLEWFPVLAQHGEWLEVKLCGGRSAWTYEPAVNISNRANLSDTIPEVTAAPEETPSPAGGNQTAWLVEAKSALVRYSRALTEGRYDDAVPLFGGGYGMLINWNYGAIDPRDYAGLLRQGCSTNGFICKMEILYYEKATVRSDMEFSFQVRLRLTDFFDSTMVWEKDRSFTVVRDCDGYFLVVEWPPLDIENLGD